VVFLFLLVIVAIIAFRLTTGEDRKQLLQKALVILREAAVIAREEYERLEPFRAALRKRTRYAIVAPALAALSVMVFARMLFGAGALADPVTLVSWGANFGPRTTNGEWWRLLTSTFVHTGFLRMALETAVLVQLGMLLERLVGRSTFAAVFVAAGVLAGLLNLSAYPMGITAGTSGAIFGLYGLLLASIVRSLRARRAVNEPQVQAQMPDEVRAEVPDEVQYDVPLEQEPAEATESTPAFLVVPVTALIWLAPAAVLFLLSEWLNAGFAFKADMAGFGVGIVAGLVLTGDIAHQAPELRRVLATVGVTCIALVAWAVPLRGIADVRPEISRIIALEDQTTGIYQAALVRVNKGAMTADALAQLIDRSIVPELEAADAHLMSIRGVPPEHRPLVATADEYLRLRASSWRLNAESWRNKVRTRRREADGTLTSDAGWHQTKAQFRAEAATRGKAEGSERASLEVLRKLKESS
jgi:membrane associated rhomboid family serine protease